MTKYLYSPVVIICILCSILGCSKADTDTRQTFSPQLEFINDSLLHHDEGRYVVFYIFPSFCGACSSGVMQYILHFTLKGYKIIYIIPSESLNQIDDFVPEHGEINTNFTTVDLTRFGFKGSTNSIYIIHHQQIVYDQLLNNESLPSVAFVIDYLYQQSFIEKIIL